MTSARLFAIGFIFGCSAVAWSILGGSIVQRTGESDQRLAQEVAQLWGGRHVQVAPEAWYEVERQVTEDLQEKDAAGQTTHRQVTRKVTDRIPVPVVSSRVTVAIALDQRRKGLLWYNTYAVRFRARYLVRNPDEAEHPVFVHFTFPSPEAIYDGFVFRVGDREAPAADDLSKGIVSRQTLAGRGQTPVEVAYQSRGLGPWTYSFCAAGVSQVRDFNLEMTTDFHGIDFPPGTLSPSSKALEGSGWRLTWAFESLVTGQRVGMDPPNKLNPGPFAARVTFFAPVSLLFFMTVMVMLGILRGQSLHPMNYFFLAAAFFAFHLLLAYLVDHVNVHFAFGLASATSLFLVVSYLRLVGGMRFALTQAGLAQPVFLVLFSYAFFFEGYTGLTVTIGAIATLFVLMQMTGRVNWTEVFNRSSSSPPKPAGGSGPQS